MYYLQSRDNADLEFSPNCTTEESQRCQVSGFRVAAAAMLKPTSGIQFSLHTQKYFDKMVATILN